MVAASTKPVEIDPADLERLREELGGHIPEAWEPWEIADEIARRKADNWLSEADKK